MTKSYEERASDALHEAYDPETKPYQNSDLMKEIAERHGIELGHLWSGVRELIKARYGVRPFLSPPKPDPAPLDVDLIRIDIDDWAKLAALGAQMSEVLVELHVLELEHKARLHAKLQDAEAVRKQQFEITDRLATVAWNANLNDDEIGYKPELHDPIADYASAVTLDADVDGEIEEADFERDGIDPGRLDWLAGLATKEPGVIVSWKDFWTLHNASKRGFKVKTAIIEKPPGIELLTA